MLDHLKVRKNAKPDMIEGLAYIFVKMLAGPLNQVFIHYFVFLGFHRLLIMI